MNSIQRTFVIATGIALVGAASAAFAGVNAGMMDQLNSRDSSPQSSAPAYTPSASSSSSSSAPSYSSAPAMSSAPQPNYRNSSSNIGRQPAQVRSQPAPQTSPGPRSAAPAAAQAEARPNYRNSGQLYTSPSTAVRPQAASGQQSGSGNEGQSNSNIGRRSGGVVGGALSRNYPNGNQGNNNGGGGHHNPGNPGNHDDDGDHHHPRPPRVVYTLPPSYYDYYYGGNLYYNFGGGWYTPYGGSYLSVGAPYGLFMTSLPGYTTSFDYDNTRYYLREDTYYTYDRSRGGYVVTPSPYGDEEDDYEDAVDEDIYVYPAQGQSEKQQADDRYACHRWGVKESGYDPIDDAFDPDRRANYMRALTACLTGRGYSVK